MPSPNISEIATATMEKRAGVVRDNVSKNNAILYKFAEKAEEPLDGGFEIREELSFAENSNGQWFSGYETLSVAAQEVLTSATFDWKQYAIAITMSGIEKLQNSGDSRVLNLLGQRIKNAESTMANAIAEALYSDGTAYGGKIITGLDAAVPQDPTTGTYGDINRATYAFWRSQLLDPGSTPTTSNIYGHMLSLWLSCKRGTDVPDVIMSGNTIYQTFVSSLQPQQRFTEPKMAAAGFENVKFMSAPVIPDGGIGGFAVDTDMYYLNTKYLHWRPHKDRNMAPDPEKRYATNQDAMVQFLMFAGNLTCSGAQFQGRLKGD